MVKVIFDSNFLFIPLQFRIDIFEQLGALLGRFEPVVLSTTVEELKSLTKKRSEKIRSQAEVALHFAGRCKVVKVEKKPRETYDDIILKAAKEWECPVATNDTTLRKRLREEGVTIIFLRQKCRLEVEGYLPQ
jgi:rRNA-processing protein FCF1